MATIARGHTPQHFAVAGWFARTLDELRRARLERQTYAELSALSDRELDDLGLTRATLREAARSAVEAY
ncbi:MAG: DUF1127 domain-containing protein [Paracoccaceae bacterium]|jgi:uncharacterized protein YjiS (DUF1127 family)|nr:DUF1127 domain-containing protein [Paracoccaceae bacterium]